MKRTLIAAAVACGLTFGVGATSAAASRPVPAGPGVLSGVECQQAGIGTLVGAGLIDDAARYGVDAEGVGNLPLRTVIQLHRTSPSTFAGDLQVSVNGVGPITASWCAAPAS